MKTTCAKLSKFFNQKIYILLSFSLFLLSRTHHSSGVLSAQNDLTQGLISPLSLQVDLSFLPATCLAFGRVLHLFLCLFPESKRCRCLLLLILLLDVVLYQQIAFFTTYFLTHVHVYSDFRHTCNKIPVCCWGFQISNSLTQLA